MNEATWKSRFDAALRVPEGALTLRVERDGYEYALERWLQMQLGKLGAPGYRIPSKGERRGWHRQVTLRRLFEKGFKAPVFSQVVDTNTES